MRTSDCLCLGFSKNKNCPIHGDPNAQLLNRGLELIRKNYLIERSREIQKLQKENEELKAELEKEKKVVDFCASNETEYKDFNEFLCEEIIELARQRQRDRNESNK